MRALANSRFNPKPGILDFWHYIRKPVPYRWPIMLASTLPFAVVLYWLSTEKVYTDPERPTITYITTFAPDRSDEEIMASNIENQELQDLREEYDEELAQRKRDLYKALGAAAGMDVEEIERRGDQERAQEEAAERARLDEMMGRTSEGAAEGSGDSEGSAP